MSPTHHGPLIHAGGAYRTLASAIIEAGGRGQVVNIVPTLLEQLIAYRDGTVHDPGHRGVDHTRRRSLRDQREILVSWGFHVTSRQLKRYPRLAELARRRRVSRDGRSRLSGGIRSGRSPRSPGALRARPGGRAGVAGRPTQSICSHGAAGFRRPTTTRSSPGFGPNRVS